MIDNHYKDEILVKIINTISNSRKLMKTQYHFYQVEPLPTKIELDEFYRNKYFNAPASQLQSKGMDAGIGDEKERYHFERQYREVFSFIKKNFNRKDVSVLDVGCGSGNFLRALKKEGFSVLCGTELDPRLFVEGVNILTGDFLELNIKDHFDFIMFNNVLEHVAEPENFIKKAKTLLNENGVIRVQVPNDLCYSQFRATEIVGKGHYYFYSPFEHLNYFNFSTLKLFLEALGLETIDQTTSFPMDLFLLLGLGDYTDETFGHASHMRRVEFEYNMGDEFLSDFYEKLSEIGFGRVVIQYARKKRFTF